MGEVTSHTLRTIKEEFDEYELEDGNILRAKHVLIIFSFTKDTKMDESGKKIVKTFSQSKLVTGVIPTGDVDTSKLIEASGDSITEKDRVKEIQYKTKKTHLNIYETDEALIFVRNKLKKVWSTKLKDKAGLPRYWVEATIFLTVENKPPFPD